MIPKAARARLQNIKTSKYLETRRLTEDVFGECGRKPWRGDTPHARESLIMSKIKITVIFGFRTKNAVVAKYRAKITVHCRGFWLPYKNYCGDQLPCNNYRALPWCTKYSVVANYRPPITVQYRGGCLPRQTLPR